MQFKPTANPTNTGRANFAPSYRPDIDGLRAIAVLSVLAFHYFPSGAPGGFVGVDIFFVISGFLISTIIFRSFAGSGFSFYSFYLHRTRRILPSLLVVLGFTMIVGRNVLLPDELSALGTHVTAAALFLENFILWRESNYFDAAIALKPLMHLWSLAIEEQFYLIFPILVWCSSRMRVAPGWTTGGILALSLAAYFYLSTNDPTAAFFAPYARFWELMSGSAIAAWRLAAPNTDNEKSYQGARSLASIVGLGFIIFSVLALGQNGGPKYPGFSGLLPVVGSALLIISGEAAIVNRVLLSQRPIVLLGLISYPLYLWHWPLLSYATFIDGKLPGIVERGALFILSILLSWLTYTLVERPIRSNADRIRPIVCSLLVLLVAFACIGYQAQLFERKYDLALNKIMSEWKFRNYSGPDGVYRDAEYGFWAIGRSSEKVALIGDSHALQYWNSFGALQQRFGTRAPQVLFPEGISVGQFSLSPTFMKRMLDDKSISTVIFSHFWSLAYASPKIDYFVRCCGKGLMETVGRAPSPLTPDQASQNDKELREVITTLRDHGKQVVIVLDNPFGSELSPRSMIHRSFFAPLSLRVQPLATQAAIERTEPTRSRIIEIAQETGAQIIDPIRFFCNAEMCPAVLPDGHPTLKDYDHLSEQASKYYVRYFDFLARQ